MSNEKPDEIVEKPVETPEVTTEDNPSTENVEEVKNEDATTEKEASKEEATEEKSEVAEPTEEKPEEPAADEEAADKTEETLKEAVSVLNEVREELAKAYVENRDLNKVKEQLETQYEALKQENNNTIKTVESLNKELEAYRAREAEAEKLAYNKRLEQLSKNFKDLGQNKTVEELSKLNPEVVTEFESITSVALKQRSEERLSSVTTPTQAMSAKKPEKLEKKPEQLTDRQLFEGFLNAMASKQKEDGVDSRRTLNL